MSGIPDVPDEASPETSPERTRPRTQSPSTVRANNSGSTRTGPSAPWPSPTQAILSRAGCAVRSTSACGPGPTRLPMATRVWSSTATRSASEYGSMVVTMRPASPYRAQARASARGSTLGGSSTVAVVIGPPRGNARCVRRRSSGPPVDPTWRDTALTAEERIHPREILTVKYANVPRRRDRLTLRAKAEALPSSIQRAANRAPARERRIASISAASSGGGLGHTDGRAGGGIGGAKRSACSAASFSVTVLDRAGRAREMRAREREEAALGIHFNAPASAAAGRQGRARRDPKTRLRHGDLGVAGEPIDDPLRLGGHEAGLRIPRQWSKSTPT